MSEQCNDNPTTFDYLKYWHDATGSNCVLCFLVFSVYGTIKNHSNERISKNTKQILNGISFICLIIQNSLIFLKKIQTLYNYWMARKVCSMSMWKRFCSSGVHVWRMLSHGSEDFVNAWIWYSFKHIWNKVFTLGKNL